jgi:site-specific DNA-adenine methylase
LYSPFFGGGAVEIAWALRNPDGKVVARDAFEPLVNFWKHIRKGEGEQMSEHIRKHYLPLEKDTFYLLQNQLRAGMGNPFARACWFYVVNRASFSGATLSGGMSPGATRFTERQLDKLATYKLPENIEIRKADSLTWLRRRTSKFGAARAFIFADPPYLLSNSKLYGDKGNQHEGFNHQILSHYMRFLSGYGSRWLITYNDSKRIRDLYAGYHFEPETWKYGMSADKDGAELFISNY